MSIVTHFLQCRNLFCQTCRKHFIHPQFDAAIQFLPVHVKSQFHQVPRGIQIRLFLVRHGENIANLTLEFSHRKVDYSLTPKGVLQARQTAAYFLDKQLQAIYSSPLKRAMETAQIIAEPLGLPVTAKEAFREVNVGDLEGRQPTAELWALHDAIVAGWMDGRPEVHFPNGENQHELVARARAGFEEILAGKKDANILIVAHGGIFTFTLRELCLDLDPAILTRGMTNCSIITLEGGLVNGRLELHLLSCASNDHLSGEAAHFSATGFNGENDPGRPRFA
jgi:broad specificity phosphatase PhoE